MLKTLVKLAKGRKVTPILNTIRVKDGYATSTDLDHYISVPVSGYNKADGDEDLTYSPHGFDKGMVFKTKFPATDFPEIKEKGKVCGEVFLNAEQIEAFKWVLLAAWDEPTRDCLMGVYFDAKDIVATDGHRLHSFKHAVKWKKNAVGAILPSTSCKLIIDMLKETKADSFSLEFHEKHYTCRIKGGIVIEGKLIDGTFPDWRKVVPNHDKKNRTIFNPAEIKAIAPKLEILSKVSGWSRKPLIIATENGEAWLLPVEKQTDERFRISMNLPFAAGFNVKYLSQMCGGMMEYGDSSSPFKVIDRRGVVERMSVIMPTRL